MSVALAMVEINPALEVGQGNVDPPVVDHVDACPTLISFPNSTESGSKAENEIDLMIQLSGMTGIPTQGND